jgi:hypothetical protein
MRPVNWAFHARAGRGSRQPAGLRTRPGAGCRMLQGNRHQLLDRRGERPSRRRAGGPPRPLEGPRPTGGPCPVRQERPPLRRPRSGRAERGDGGGRRWYVRCVPPVPGPKQCCGARYAALGLGPVSPAGNIDLERHITRSDPPEGILQDPRPSLRSPTALGCRCLMPGRVCRQASGVDVAGCAIGPDRNCGAAREARIRNPVNGPASVVNLRGSLAGR